MTKNDLIMKIISCSGSEQEMKELNSLIQNYVSFLTVKKKCSLLSTTLLEQQKNQTNS